MSVLTAKYFHDEAEAFHRLESMLWPNGPVCPHCGSMGRIYALKARTKKSKKHPEGVERHGLKMCGECRKQFTVRIGTIFEDSHAPLHKWFQAIHLMCASKKGISAHQLHRMLEVQYKTAWFMEHRIREAMRSGPLAPMGGGGGIVEIDETVQGRTATAPHRLKMPSRIYGGWAHRNVVLTLVERGGEARSFHVSGTSVAEIMPIIRANVSKEAAVMTDSAPVYKYMDRTGGFASHDRVDHSSGEYARYEEGRPVITTNTVESYFSVFKRGMKGTYQHCSEKHLHRYLAEFDFRYNNRSALGVEDAERAAKAVVGAKGKRLTYRQPNGT
jgi:transposase-like protein